MDIPMDVRPGKLFSYTKCSLVVVVAAVVRFDLFLNNIIISYRMAMLLNRLKQVWFDWNWRPYVVRALRAKRYEEWYRKPKSHVYISNFGGVMEAKYVLVMRKLHVKTRNVISIHSPSTMPHRKHKHVSWMCRILTPHHSHCLRSQPHKTLLTWKTCALLYANINSINLNRCCNANVYGRAGETEWDLWNRTEVISNYWIYYSYSCRLFLWHTLNKDEWLAIFENSVACSLARFCRLFFGFWVKLQNNYHQLTEVIWVLCTSQENVPESLLLNRPFGVQSSRAMIVAFLRPILLSKNDNRDRSNKLFHLIMTNEWTSAKWYSHMKHSS